MFVNVCVVCYTLFVAFLKAKRKKFMSKVHVELGGFAGFDTVEEARAFAHAVEELLDARADANKTVCKIYDFETQGYRDIHKYELDMSKVFVGLQGATARLNQLAGYARKQTTLPEDFDWAEHILVCVNNRYSVDETTYIRFCSEHLVDGVNSADFVAGLPVEKIVPVN